MDKQGTDRNLYAGIEIGEDDEENDEEIGTRKNYKNLLKNKDQKQIQNEKLPPIGKSNQ